MKNKKIMSNNELSPTHTQYLPNVSQRMNRKSTKNLQQKKKKFKPRWNSKSPSTLPHKNTTYEAWNGLLPNKKLLFSNLIKKNTKTIPLLEGEAKSLNITNK